MTYDRTTLLLDQPLTKLKGRVGGKRAGSGPPPFAIRRLAEEAIREAQASGELPIDYMLRVMRDETATDERRDMMAIAAAPYLHARLTRSIYGGAGEGPLIDAAAPLVGALVVGFGREEPDEAAATDAESGVVITPPAENPCDMVATSAVLAQISKPDQ